MDPYGFWSCKNSPSTQSPKDSGTEFGANLLPQKAVKSGNCAGLEGLVEREKNQIKLRKKGRFQINQTLEISLLAEFNPIINQNCIYQKPQKSKRIIMGRDGTSFSAHPMVSRPIKI